MAPLCKYKQQLAPAKDIDHFPFRIRFDNAGLWINNTWNRRTSVVLHSGEEVGTSRMASTPLNFRDLFSKPGTSTAYAHHSKEVSKLMQFFESPEWISQTDEYFEQESIMFDPSVPDSDLYKQIHDNYKILIDKLLVDWRNAIGMSPEVMQETVEHAKQQSSTNKIVRELMQPMMLYEDYNLFKLRMINQNIELQIFAMESIQKKTGSFPLSISGDNNNPPRRFQDTDDALLEMVLKRSKEEYDALQRQIQEEEDAIERALRESERIAELLANQSKVSVYDLKVLVQQMEALTSVPEETEEHQSLDAPPAVTITTALSRENPDEFVSVKQFISPEELKRRQAYLRAQRDKLQSKKMELKASEAAAAAEASAVAAVPATNQNAMESRKRLAAKLKTEIAEKHK